MKAQRTPFLLPPRALYVCNCALMQFVALLPQYIIPAGSFRRLSGIRCRREGDTQKQGKKIATHARKTRKPPKCQLAACSQTSLARITTSNQNEVPRFARRRQCTETEKSSRCSLRQHLVSDDVSTQAPTGRPLVRFFCAHVSRAYLVAGDDAGTNLFDQGRHGCLLGGAERGTGETKREDGIASSASVHSREQNRVGGDDWRAPGARAQQHFMQGTWRNGLSSLEQMSNYQPQGDPPFVFLCTWVSVSCE